MAHIVVWCNRSRLAAIGFVVACCLGAPAVSKAQGVIEDRGEIEDTGISDKSVRVGVIDVPFDGLLKVQYLGTYSHLDTLLWSEVLTVSRNGPLFSSETFVAERFENPDQGELQLCNNVSGKFHWYLPGGSEGDTWDTGRVDKGDIVVMHAFSVGASYVQTSPSTWDVQIETTGGCKTLLLGVTVARDTLTIEVDEPKEVWPSITSGASLRGNEMEKGAADGFDYSLVVDSIGVTITMEDGGSPIASKQVTVSAEWVSKSGGHNHTNLPFPTGWLQFRDLAEPLTITADEITVTTDASGEANLRFFAPPWGGRVRLSAASTYSSKVLEDVDSLDVQVPDLVRLADAPGVGSMLLVGGRCEHHGPGGGGSCGTPDDNHYALESTIQTLIAINDAWVTDQNDTPSSELQTPFTVNDMSLPMGGKFIIVGNWTRNQKHGYHRVGRDVDIRTQHLGNQRVGIYVEEAPWKRPNGSDEFDRANAVFEEFVRFQFGPVRADVHAPHDPNNEHYHLYFYP